MALAKITFPRILVKTTAWQKGVEAMRRKCRRQEHTGDDELPERGIHVPVTRGDDHHAHMLRMFLTFCADGQ